MEKIMKKINQCTSVCYVMNIAIFQSKGKKMSNHFLVPASGNMTIEEINDYLVLFFDELFVPFSSKEEVASIGTDQIRDLDASIIEDIRKLSIEERYELYLLLEAKEQVVRTKYEEVSNLRAREISHLNDIDRKTNNVDFIDTADCVKDLSKKASALNFFHKRYSHYLSYIRGLCQCVGENKKLELKV